MNQPHPEHDPTVPGTSDDHAADSFDAPLRTITSAELFHGAREVLIQHDEKTYRLQVTRNGKLILVK